MSGKTLKQPTKTSKTSFDLAIAYKIQSLGMSGLRSCRNLLAAPTVIMMFLNVRKHLKTTHLIILKSLCFKTYQYMRISGLKSSRSLLAAPTMFRMVLDVRKQLKTTHLSSLIAFVS